MLIKNLEVKPCLERAKTVCSAVLANDPVLAVVEDLGFVCMGCWRRGNTQDQTLVNNYGAAATALGCVCVSVD